MEEGKTTKVVLDRLAVSKRGFIRGVLVGSAFVVPMVASFSMDTMRPGISSAWASYGNSSGIP
ncbi:MAG TPA: hypothetical protein VF449_05550 [Parvibaculum sp.]